MAGGRDVDDLTAKCMYKGIVFAFRITDDHVIFCHKEDIADLPLCGEGFTGTRGTENQSVGILEFLSVHHNHVVGKCIKSVIK